MERHPHASRRGLWAAVALATAASGMGAGAERPADAARSAARSMPGRIFFLRGGDLWVLERSRERRLLTGGVTVVSAGRAGRRIVIARGPRTLKLREGEIPPPTDLWTLDTATGKLRRLTREGGCRRPFRVGRHGSNTRQRRWLPGSAIEPRLSPDGARVLYTWLPNYRLHDLGDGKGLLRVIDLRTGRGTAVDEFAFAWGSDQGVPQATTWHPSGKTAVVVSTSEAEPTLVLLRFGGFGSGKVLPVPQRRIVMNMAWRPDGRVLAAALATEGTGPSGQSWALALTTLSGRVLRVLATSKEGMDHPAWSPDGRYLAYTTGPVLPGPAGGTRVAIVDGHTGQPVATIEGAQRACWTR